MATHHEPPKSGIPKRKKIAMHIGFLAKSITFLGQIMVSDQLLPNSSRATTSSAEVTSSVSFVAPTVWH
jgi:hypothetical protein